MEALAAVGSADGGSKLAGGDGKRIRHSNPGGIIAEITVGEIIENLRRSPQACQQKYQEKQNRLY